MESTYGIAYTTHGINIWHSLYDAWKPYIPYIPHIPYIPYIPSIPFRNRSRTVPEPFPNTFMNMQTLFNIGRSRTHCSEAFTNNVPEHVPNKPFTNIRTPFKLGLGLRLRHARQSRPARTEFHCRPAAQAGPSLFLKVKNLKFRERRPPKLKKSLYT